MREHNRIVIQALNDYLRVDKPGYGILVKGDWGCGKSFLIKQWKKKIEDGLSKKEDDDEEAINLKPIYISLNGFSSVAQIDEALKRAISPFLHGNFMKGLGKALTIATSIALRVNVDLNRDNIPEQMVCTIDPKTLLEFDQTKVKGQRILIFDDIERAKLPIEEILGYINYFVEQVGCHVVLIGDVTNVDSEDVFKQIKEKTIGHEFRIESEIEEALSVFIKEVDKEGKLALREMDQHIIHCFRVSGVSNLRILRQSICDYKSFVSHLPKEIKEAEEFKRIREYLLANFIIVYAEYKSGNLVMEGFGEKLASESFNTLAKQAVDKETKRPTPATDTLTKYQQAGLNETHRVLEKGYVSCLMKYLIEGEIDAEFLMGEVKRDRGTPWEKLGEYRRLSNEEFKNCLNRTASYLQNGDFGSIDFMLMAVCNMLEVIKRGMTYGFSTEKVIGWCKQHIEEKFFPACKTQDELYVLRNHALRCINYYQDESIIEECRELNQRIEDAFKKTLPKMNNSLTELLESLTNDSIKTLNATYLKAIPDHSVTYSMSSIFSQVDPETFVRGFVKLNNSSKTDFILFVRRHYLQALSPSNAKDFIHYYEDDLNKLPTIVGLLKKEADHECYVDKDNILTLADLLTRSSDRIQFLIKEKSKK